MRAGYASRSIPQGHPANLFLVELMEPRCFMSVSSWTADSISNVSGAYFGEALMGDNGSYWGCPTATAGTGDEAEIWTYRPWDSNLDDGLDSGWCTFEMYA